MMGISHGPRWTERLRDTLTSGETRDDAVITYTNTPGTSSIGLMIFEINSDKMLQTTQNNSDVGKYVF